MEEYFETNQPITAQWKQLFPDHFYDAIMNEYPIVSIIVAPNEGFNYNSDNFKIPTFVKKTNELFKWKNKENNHFYSEEFDINIYIFYTMFPTKNTLINQEVSSDFITTTTDIDFVLKFYNTLENCFKNIIKNNGCVSCFSFAVFNSETDNSKIQNFEMFRELRELKLKIPSLFLAEWNFKFDNYLMKEISNFPYFNNNNNYFTYQEFDTKYKILKIKENKFILI
jgi:hypothetical protein